MCLATDPTGGASRAPLETPKIGRGLTADMLLHLQELLPIWLLTLIFSHLGLSPCAAWLSDSIAIG